jgi:hypothetical protein
MMKTIWTAALLGVALAAGAASGPKIDDPVEGKRMAEEIRALFPAENFTHRGVLRVFQPKAATRYIPITSRVQAGEQSWTATYEARPADGPPETLVIRHFADKPSEYEWTVGERTARLVGNAATNAFAGSDFALMDLGLEFFHWPTQILATREMRKGRGSDVLESRPASPNLYSRVVSWIDQETRGLLMAEAFDPRGRLQKEFEVKSFSKVGGQWQLKEVEIRNRQTKSSTRLQFQFDEQ